MNLFKIVLFLASSYSLFAQSVTKIRDWDDRNMRLDYIHIPNYNDDGFWVENPSYYSRSNSIVNKQGEFEFLYKKLTYKVNDLRFFKRSHASKYVSKIKRLAIKDGVEIHIATYKDRRGRICYNTKLEDHVTCWHINPAPKETISDYVGDFSIVHPSSRLSSLAEDNICLTRYHSKICHVYFTQRIFLEIKSFVDGRNQYSINFNPLLKVTNNNKLNIYEEHKSTYVSKLNTQTLLKFLYHYKFALNNDGFYAPKLITDHCNYCNKPHDRHETLDMYPRLVSSSPPSSFFEEFEELKNSSLAHSN